MEHTITLTIPSDWLEGQPLDQDELRQALMLGLVQLRQRQAALNTAVQVVQVLLSTDRIRHLSAGLVESEGTDTDRQVPPELPGPPVSDILIAQRRGEM